MALSIEEINTAGRRHAVREVDIPALGGSVYVREVSAGEYDAIQLDSINTMRAPERVKMFRAKCCAYFLSDENGKRLYTDAQIHILNEFNGLALDAVFEAGMKFNKMADFDVSEQEKN